MPWNVRMRPGSPGFAPSLRRDARDPDAQVLEVVAVFGAPDLGQQLRVEHDLAGVRGEVLQEQPLGARELDELAVAGDHAPLEVDLDVVERDDARRRAAAPDERRMTARTRAASSSGWNGLGDVVVGAEVEALRLVGGGALGGQQDHRHGPALAQLPHDLDAVEVGHDDVEQDDVRPDLFGLLRARPRRRLR